MAGNSPLARMLAGLPAKENYSPMPKANGGMTPWNPQTVDILPPFQIPGMATPAPPLPPYLQPGSSLPFEDYYTRPRPAPAPAPAAYTQPQVVAPPVQTGGQGWGGPEPAPGSIPAAYDANTDPRYLPEQWRGSFNNWQYPK